MKIKITVPIVIFISMIMIGVCNAQIREERASTTEREQGASTKRDMVPDIPEGRLYPKIKVLATSLVVVDLAKDKIEGQIAACGLQGIVNRTSEKKIYVMNTLCRDNRGGWNNGPGEGNQSQMGRIWLRELFADIPQKELPIDSIKENPGFMALLADFVPYVKGIVIYDPALEEATIEAATTIAGQTDGLIVSPGLANQIKSYNFPVLVDFQGKFKTNIECLEWLKTNYFATANKQVAFTWSHMTTDSRNSWGAANKDYVVANRLFTFFLNIQIKEESAYYEKIIKGYPAGTPVMGWTDERMSDKLFAGLGYFMVPYISVENLTVMSSFPSIKGFQPKPKAFPIENNTVYVACCIADGDNLEHTMVYNPYTIINSKNFGTVPVTWIINPGIVDLAPRVFQWYQSKTGDQEWGAMMGDGSPAPDRYSGFLFYCNFTRHYLEKSGIRSMKQMVESEAVSWRVQPYFCNGGYAGTDSRGAGSNEFHMDNNCFHIGTTNIKEPYLSNALNSAPANQPLFLSIFCGTASSRDIPTAIKNLVDELKSRNDGRKYVFLRSMDLAATYRTWKGMPVE